MGSALVSCLCWNNHHKLTGLTAQINSTAAGSCNSDVGLTGPEQVSFEPFNLVRSSSMCFARVLNSLLGSVLLCSWLLIPVDYS